MTTPMLVIVTPTYRDAVKVARRQYLPEQVWVWAATNEIAARWIYQASVKGVRLERLQDHEARTPAPSRPVVVVGRDAA